MRKSFLLFRDSGVKKSTQSIASLKHHDQLKEIKYVMLPILTTSASYMAVAGEFINGFDFDVGYIRYHMQLSAISRGSDNQMMETCVYDYSTVTATTHSIEEFYNALHNIFANHYVRELSGNIDGLDRVFFIRISEIEITIMKGKHVSDHFIVQDSDFKEVPFDIDQSYKIVRDIALRYGIEHAEYLTLYNISFRFDRSGELHWRREKQSIDYMGLSYVCIGNPFASTFTILKAADYEVALRMSAATIYINPINLMDLGSTIEHPAYQKLTVTSYFNIPKYEFNTDDESAICIAMDMLNPHIMEIYSIIIRDPEDIIGAIEYIPNLLKTYHEVIKADIAESLDIDSLCGLDMLSTVMIDVAIEVEPVRPYPAESILHIQTDVFQDIMPKLKEVCYLLSLEEKSK